MWLAQIYYTLFLQYRRTYWPLYKYRKPVLDLEMENNSIWSGLSAPGVRPTIYQKIKNIVKNLLWTICLTFFFFISPNPGLKFSIGSDCHSNAMLHNIKCKISIKQKIAILHSCTSSNKNWKSVNLELVNWH